MYSITLQFEKDDVALKQALNEHFGSDIKYNAVKNFDGLNVFLTVIIPISALSLQLFDFILTHFADKKTMPSTNGCIPKRLLVDKEGNIDLTNYNKDEAIEILKAYFDNQRQI